MSRRWPVRRAAELIAGAAAWWGLVAAFHYHRLGLTLAHYDARAHLVVARRVFDSLTPGWQQVGAVWLPLPHLLNTLPVQNDYLYRTGFSGVAISIASMALAAWAIATLIQRATGSVAGGAVAAALLMLNPDVLYLASTPMSEPLLFGTTFLAIALVADWATRVQPLTPNSNPEPRTSALPPPTSDLRHPTTRAAGWALIAAALSRYEAWPIVAAAIALAFAVLLRRGWSVGAAARAVRGLALWPVWAIAAFLVNSKVSVGSWFVSSGFFVPENPSLGHPWMAWTDVWNGLLRLTGPALPWIAAASAIVLVVAFLRSRERAAVILPLTLVACAALPLSAYYEGHPVRLRYGVPLAAAAAALTGTAVALLPRRARGAAAVAVIAVAVWQAPPFVPTAPVVVESQRDAQNAAGRQAVTMYLRAHWDGQPILMSMGSLGHYMHDLADAGFYVRDFIHEGNGDIWRYAAVHPHPFAAWIAIEEQVDNRDGLSWQAKHDPAFLAGYVRVAEGGGVALYRRF